MMHYIFIYLCATLAQKILLVPIGECDPYKTCKRMESEIVKLNAYNINQMRCIVEVGEGKCALVKGWNDHDGLFVLYPNGTIVPYTPESNCKYVLCRRDKEITPKICRCKGYDMCSNTIKWVDPKCNRICENKTPTECITDLKAPEVCIPQYTNNTPPCNSNMNIPPCNSNMNTPPCNSNMNTPPCNSNMNTPPCNSNTYTNSSNMNTPQYINTPPCNSNIERKNNNCGSLCPLILLILCILKKGNCFDSCLYDFCDRNNIHGMICNRVVGDTRIVHP